METEKCPMCENHALIRTPRERIMGEFFGTLYLKATEHQIMCLKCEYKSEPIRVSTKKTWWNKILGS